MKKKKWYYILMGLIFTCIVTFFLLSFWIFKVINQKEAVVTENNEIKIHRLISEILPHLSYRDNEVVMKELSKSEQLLLAIKISYFTPEVVKSTIGGPIGKQIQIDGSAVHETLKKDFNLSFPRNLPDIKKPLFLAYDEIRDLYILNITNDYWNISYKNGYEIEKIEDMRNGKKVVTVKHQCDRAMNRFEVRLDCKKNCYFESSKIIENHLENHA